MTRTGNVVRRGREADRAREYDDKAARALPNLGRAVIDPTHVARSSRAREMARVDLVGRLVLAFEAAQVACDRAGMVAAIEQMRAEGMGALAAYCGQEMGRGAHTGIKKARLTSGLFLGDVD